MIESNKKYFGLACFLFAFLIYWPALNYDFTYDDPLHITNNSAVTHPGSSLKSLTDIFRIPTYPGDLYRPIPTITYRITAELFGTDPFAYHLTNILLYGLLAVLSFYFLSHFFTQGVALYSAALFLVHPLHIEPVVNIVGRAELLGLLFALTSTLCLINYAKSDCKRNGYVLGGLVFALAAVFSKESYLTFIAVAPLLVLYANEKRETKAAKLCLLIWCLAVLSYLVARQSALGSLINFEHATQSTEYFENPLINLSFSERILPALSLYGRYALKTILPLGLSADYSTSRNDFFSNLYSMRGLFEVGVSLLLMLTLWLQRKSRTGLFLWFYFLAFALTINLVLPIGTVFADRLAFAPSLGLIAFLVASGASLISNHKFKYAYSSAVTTALIVLTVHRIPVWQNDETLFRSMISDNPKSPKAHFNLAYRLSKTSGSLEEVESLCTTAAKLNRNYFSAYFCLGDVALNKGRLGQAEFWYKRALEIEPGNADVTMQLDKIKNRQ